MFVVFAAAVQDFLLLCGVQFKIIHCQQLIAMRVKPADKLPPLAHGYCLDAGFNLLHAHGANFTAPGPDCE